MTPLLYHGPLARDRAVERAAEIGRPISEPLGDSGLKVDDSRLIVLKANQSGVGDKAPSLVVGPLDRATPEAADALLKTLEDMAQGPLRLVLWADYLGGVRPTIRSRTRAVWCPVTSEDTHYIDPLYYLEADAKKLLGYLLKGDHGRVLGMVLKADKGWPELLNAVVQQLPDLELEGEDAQTVMALWPRIRIALDGRGGPASAADALLPPEL